MWGSVLALTFLSALNPVRLGFTLLVVSRPRPVQNLLVFWVGGLIEGVLAMLVPLTLLHVTPMFKSFADDLATGSTARDIRIGLGVLALSIAALITLRSLTRRRQRAHVPALGGNGSTLVLDSNRPNAILRLLGSTQDAPTEGGSVIRRLLRRVHKGWEDGSLWVSFVIGGGFSGVEPDLALFVVAMIVASGVSIDTQVTAAMTFVVGILAVVEITLVSYLVTPAKTQAMLQVVHDWAFAHRRKILVTMCTLGGVALVARGMGSI